MCSTCCRHDDIRHQHLLTVLVRCAKLIQHNARAHAMMVHLGWRLQALWAGTLTTVSSKYCNMDCCTLQAVMVATAAAAVPLPQWAAMSQRSSGSVPTTTPSHSRRA
jgi:hypothetical protein